MKTRLLQFISTFPSSQRERPIFASARINFTCIVDVAPRLSLFLIHHAKYDISAAACHFALHESDGVCVFFYRTTQQTVLITCIAFFCLRRARSQYIGHRSLSVVDSDCAPLMNYKTNLLRATSTMETDCRPASQADFKWIPLSPEKRKKLRFLRERVSGGSESQLIKPL
jgi:hypothetical protein